MARESYAETTIPANGAEQVPYKDNRELVNGSLRHMGEMFIGQVTGAGGAGGTLAGVPFEPAVIELINEAGATPTWTKHVNLGSGFIGLAVAAAAADATANAPTITRNGEADFDVELVTGDAPDGEVITVICYSARDIAGGL